MSSAGLSLCPPYVLCPMGHDLCFFAAVGRLHWIFEQMSNGFDFELCNHIYVGRYVPTSSLGPVCLLLQTTPTVLQTVFTTTPLKSGFCVGYRRVVIGYLSDCGLCFHIVMADKYRHSVRVVISKDEIWEGDGLIFRRVKVAARKELPMKKTFARSAMHVPSKKRLCLFSCVLFCANKVNSLQRMYYAG